MTKLRRVNCGTCRNCRNERNQTNEIERTNEQVNERTEAVTCQLKFTIRLPLYNRVGSRCMFCAFVALVDSGAHGR